MQGRKIVFTSPNKVETQTTDFDLKIENSNEVILKNKVSLVSAGTELACLSGNESWFTLPNTPGYIAVGEVLEAGSNVNVKTGEICFTYGPHAEYYKIDTSDRFGGICIPMPGDASMELIPFTRMASIAMTGIRVSTIELGDPVVVLGQGLVGNLAAQLAGLQGGQVIGVDIDENRLALSRKCGIEQTVNSGSAGWKDRIMEIADGGVMTIIDATGNASVIQEACDLVRPYGECVLLGSPRVPYETNLTDMLNKVHLPPFVTMKGALEWRFPTFKNEFVKHSIEQNSEIIMQLIHDGRLIVQPLLTHQLDPAKAAEAYLGLKTKGNEYLGVEFNWN